MAGPGETLGSPWPRFAIRLDADFHFSLLSSVTIKNFLCQSGAYGMGYPRQGASNTTIGPPLNRRPSLKRPYGVWSGGRGHGGP
jgi:hypothetical protein